MSINIINSTFKPEWIKYNTYSSFIKRKCKLRKSKLKNLI